MNEPDFFDVMIEQVRGVTSFAVLGGECDEYVRFLQLEWESYAPGYTQVQKERFYRELEYYKKFRAEKRNWREDFGGRDFGKLVV